MDWTSIIVAVIALLGTAVGSFSGFKLTSYRVQELERKVDRHNGFAERIPVLEHEVKELTRRIERLEGK